MAKTKLTRAEHVRLGKELVGMRDRLGSIAVELSRAYTQPLADSALRAQTAIDRLRSKLDGILFREHPDRSTKDNIGVYYPRGRRK